MKALISALLLSVLSVLGCGGSGYGYTTNTSGGTISGTTTLNVSVTNSGVSYAINGYQNPTIILQRGISYTFNLNNGGHPFYIMSVQGTNYLTNAYNTGVTNNGGQTGQLIFTVPAGAPSTLYYNCSIHSAMTGTITITN